MDSCESLIELAQELKTRHVIKYPINQVWPIISDLTICDHLFSHLWTETEFTFGDDTYSVGNQFTKVYFSNRMIFTCTESINSENFKKINWRIVQDKTNFLFNFSYTMYPDTSNNSTFLVWDIIYDDNELSPLSPQYVEGDLKVRKECTTKWSDYLKHEKVPLIQVESVIINSRIDKVWNLLTNWISLSQVAPLIADDVECTGDPTEVNTIVKLFFIDKKMMCHLRVKNVEEQNENNLLYRLECFYGLPKVPHQDIQFQIVKINDKSCYLSFAHEFREKVNSKMIASLQSDKRKILGKIKNYMEERF